MSTVTIRNDDVAPAERPSWAHAGGLVAEDPSFFRGVLGGVRSGVLAVGRDGRLLLINKQGAEILGYEGPPAPGAPCSEAFADHPRLVRMLSQAFTLANLPNRAEIDLGPGRREGTRIGFTVSHILGDGGECVGAAVFFKDLTRIERSAEKERLRDRLAALGEMAARLAHEVRNPLASIEVTCGLLRRRIQSDENGRALVDTITAEVRRLNETVTSSLEFVKPLASQFSSGELKPLLDGAIDAVRRREGDARILIAYGKHCDAPAFRMDAGQLRQVFENLLLNAADALDGHGRIIVDVERAPAPAGGTVPWEEQPRGVESEPAGEFDEWIVVRVSDDGPGIPDHVRDRIFHPFFTTKHQGSGVGLSTVKKIVDSHGGLIDVDRSAAGGARFTVRLPMIIENNVKPEGQQR